VSQQLVAAMATGMMQQAAKDYGAGYLTGLKLVEFELGEVSLRMLKCCYLLNVTCYFCKAGAAGSQGLRCWLSY
jgi:hypothetical protein